MPEKYKDLHDFTTHRDSWPAQHNDEVTAHPARHSSAQDSMQSVSEAWVHQTGEALGAPYPDWPEDLTTYAERKAYQRGVADARHLPTRVDAPVLTNTLVTIGYNDKGDKTLQGARTSFDPSKDHSVMECALMFREAVVVRKQANITPEVLWEHIMGSKWVAPPKSVDVVESGVKLTALQKDAVRLLFAVHDAWPYVHAHCTIATRRESIAALMRKHGDFGDLADIKRDLAKLERPWFEEDQRSVYTSPDLTHDGEGYLDRETQRTWSAWLTRASK